MELSIEATYENGVLKPLVPLLLKEHEKVRITITGDAEWVRAACGQRTESWEGGSTQRRIERIALDPEFGIEESP